jgi:biotin carboxyl carrier protein
MEGFVERIAVGDGDQVERGAVVAEIVAGDRHTDVR